MSEENVEQPAAQIVDLVDDAPTPVEVASLEEKRQSKIDQKKAAIFRERMQRLVNDGKTPQEAFAHIQKEDYMRLPVGERLELLRRYTSQSIEGLGRDLSTLYSNQRDLADVMDLNFRTFGKILTKLGIAPEEQTAILKQTEDEVRAARVAVEEAKAAAQKAVEEKAADTALEKAVDVPGTPEVPEGATVFGG